MPGDGTSRLRIPGAVRRLGWFVGLWLAGVAALGFVALIIRSVIGG